MDHEKNIFLNFPNSMGVVKSFPFFNGCGKVIFNWCLPHTHFSMGVEKSFPFFFVFDTHRGRQDNIKNDVLINDVFGV